MSILCAESRVADVVFRYLERDYAYVMEQKSVEEQEEVCRLALLQYYSTQVELTGQRREYASQLLEEFNRKGMRFAFWNKFDRELLAPYQMEGRVFAEYVGNPDSTVTIFYRSKGSEEEYHKETMKTALREFLCGNLPFFTEMRWNAASKRNRNGTEKGG